MGNALPFAAHETSGEEERMTRINDICLARCLGSPMLAEGYVLAATNPPIISPVVIKPGVAFRAA